MTAAGEKLAPVTAKASEYAHAAGEKLQPYVSAAGEKLAPVTAKASELAHTAADKVLSMAKQFCQILLNSLFPFWDSAGVVHMCKLVLSCAYVT